ncbi:hypothetical protein OUZ56_000672 [Daphnia magna]|uniref:1-phosphatidylinositol-3-phosphate 5-kinase n=1 Tax=Daphnia magna TaxID=35525 RepID=A0ABR0A0K8_9CRUS|nr:hypothetical protein OUZ56_000672 [Daphnia magna]
MYSEAEFKQYWMPDSVSKECYECSYKFTALRRRHHCRICGQIFCSRCCHQQVPGKLMGYSGDLRACTYCCHIVLSCLKSIDPSTDGSTDLSKIQEDLQKKLALLQPFSATRNTEGLDSGGEQKSRKTVLKRKISLSFQEERFTAGTSSNQPLLSSAERKVLLHDSTQLKTLHEEIVHPQRGILLQNHRYKLRSITNCCAGSEVVDWLLVQDKASSRIQATAIGQALVDAGFLECLSSTDQIFTDGYSLYRPKSSDITSSINDSLASANQSEVTEVFEPEDTQEPLWVRQIGMQEDRKSHIQVNEGEQSSFRQPAPARLVTPDTDMIDGLGRQNEPQLLLLPPKKSEELSLPTDLNSPNPTIVSSPTMPQAEAFALPLPPITQESLLFFEHIQRLMKQLLSWQGLSFSWADVLMPLVQNLAHTVRPDVRDDDDEMDIRQYIHIKKIPGGTKSDSKIVHGVVCSKNVANRSMPRWSHDPNILLLSSAIDYQRVESKLISLEPLMMQENEYLKNAVAKIAAFKPEVLLVEKVVSGLAQEFLYNLGITLVLNVKSSVMDRVSRCCQADIVPSIDAHQLSRPKLGSCRLFHVETLTLDRNNSTKTLMFFDGCQPRLGATVLLRGASHFELRKVKKVLKFMAFACYNGRLERAFLADEFAIPKMLGCRTEMFDGVELVPNTEDAPLLNSTRLDDNLTFESSSLVIVDSDSIMSPETNANKSSACVPMERTVPDDTNATDLKPVRELDDPLHEYLRIRQGDQSLSSTPVQQPQQSLSVHSSTLATNSMLFRKAMEDTILSISPLIRHPLPYLETEAGRNAPLRKFLPEVLYFSQQLKQSESPPRKIRYGQDDVMNGDSTCADPAPERNSIHPFLRARITPVMSRTELLGLLSDFRARGVRPGCKLPEQVTKSKLSMSGSDDWENLATEEDNQADGGGLKDCLDPFNLQRLCALFSSFCQPVSTVAPQYCVAPWVVEMDFYGRNDITLGGFLERYCFHKNYSCPSASCQSPMASHIRRFVHDTSSIVVIIRQLANSVNYNAAASGASVADDRSILMWSWCKKCKQVSPISTMSTETWHFSFAKYLELRFYGHAYCRRQLTSSNSVPVCACPHPLHTEHFHYFGCRDLVASFKYAPIVLKEVVLAQPAIAISVESDLLPQLIEEIRLVAQFGHGLYSAIGEWLKALTAECTGTKLESQVVAMVEQQIQERSRFRKRVEEIQLMLTSPNLQQVSSPGSGEESLWLIADHEVLLKRIIADTVCSWNARLQEVVAAKKKEDKSSASKPLHRNLQSSESDPVEAKPLPPAPPIFTISPNSSRDDSATDMSRKMSEHSMSPSSLSSSPTKSPFLRPRSSVDFQFIVEQQSETGTPMDHRSRSISQVSNDHLENSESKSATALPVTPLQTRVSLGALLSMTGPGPSLLTMPFPSTEHHLLPPGSSLPLVVYQNEPSSIIAYALASVDYEQQLAELQADLADQAGPSSPNRTSSPIGPDRWFDNIEREEPGGRSYGSSSTSGIAQAPPAGALASNHHLEIQFSDSCTKFYCRVYYAEQFRALRSKVFPAGEDRFIRSLARCAPWAASGGKSGSTFCKTLDDRFVLKQMSKMEIQSFVDLVPNYISYTHRAQRENRPTAFCKIVGAFRIVFKNAQTNVASKQDLLVMENLFYKKNVTRKFDLKGSERNRLVSASEAEMSDCVLLDENFVQMTWDNPLYVRGYSQSVLNKALSADTQFLASQLVMDYSLLVGIDDENNQLIVGLIDYIRTFTWDKRLETFVKSSGILGGQGKMPTVVSPELYRTRFCEAMNRYFTSVPSFWDGGM